MGAEPLGAEFKGTKPIAVWRRRLAALMWAAACMQAQGHTHEGAAASMPFSSPFSWASCPNPPVAEAADWDVHLQLAALIQAEWRARAAPVALISRSGLNLQPIGHHYSHAGFLTSAGTVRQLYFDCETARPRVFDEGLASFVGGVSREGLPRFSVVWWPPDPAGDVARTVADEGLGAAMVAPVYQAQAHVWSPHTQNCNQWLVEMLGVAFGGGADRAAAQAWLRAQGYSGSVVQLPWVGWLMAAALLPHMGLRHHPDSDLQALRFEVSLPAAVERFVERRWPQAERVEWCLRGREVVVRRRWQPLDRHCTPADGDERLSLVP
jgi:hypothetical protein